VVLQAAKSITFGRGSEANERIEDKRLSRIHAEITFHPKDNHEISKAVIYARGKNPIIIQRKGTDMAIELYNGNNCLIYPGDKFSLLPSGVRTYTLRVTEEKADEEQTDTDTEIDEPIQKTEIAK